MLWGDKILPYFIAYFSCIFSCLMVSFWVENKNRKCSKLDISVQCKNSLLVVLLGL